MKKTISLMVALFTIIFLFGCEKATDISQDETSSVAETLSDYPMGLSISLPQLGKENQSIYYVQRGSLTLETSNDTVAVLADSVTDDGMLRDAYIAAEIDGSIITYELGKWESTVFSNGSLSLTDLDNDGVDEIILFMEVTGNGGTFAQIYRVQGDKIDLLYDLNELDLGLSGKIQNQTELLLENGNIGYSQLFDLSESHEQDTLEALVDPENVELLFYCIDACSARIDADAEYPQIHCDRLLYTTGNLIFGNLHTVFSYDAESNELKLTGAELFDIN